MVAEGIFSNFGYVVYLDIEQSRGKDATLGYSHLLFKGVRVGGTSANFEGAGFQEPF